MYCKHCMRQIDDDAAFCPACGKPQKTPPRKPIYKRWWFWAIVIVLFVTLTGGDDEEPASTVQTPSLQEPATVQADTQPAQQVADVVPIETDDGATLGQKNALRSAKNYLDFMAFSYEGLIEQLEYEGYTNSEATYAAMKCGADWNEQALLKAESYLDNMAFSRKGLIEQLEFEGFTTDEATYGVDRCVVNWNEQAAKRAESYLDTMPFSREGLIEQLEYEGFTHEQAVYGVQQNGY